jgi:hypothetical protein
MHKSITLARVTRAVERSHNSLDNPGFCKACGKSADGCEPDARNYECDEPITAFIECQDWFQPWARAHIPDSEEILLAYARCFWFGE